jgi:hypothetical protein
MADVQLTEEQLDALLGGDDEEEDEWKEPPAPRFIGVGSRWSYQPGGYAARVPIGRRGSRATDMDIFAAEGNDTLVAPIYDDRFLYGMATLDPGAIRQIQNGLIAAGLMDDDDGYTPNVFDETTMDAFSVVLGYANRAGIDWETAFEELVQGGAERLSKRKGARGPVFTARLSNPDDLKKVFRQAAYNVQGGQFVPPDQEQAFIDAYHQLEYGAQRAVFDSQVGGGGTVIEAPSAQTLAEDQAEAADPVGAQARRLGSYAQVIGEMIGGI